MLKPKTRKVHEKNRNAEINVAGRGAGREVHEEVDDARPEIADVGDTQPPQPSRRAVLPMVRDAKTVMDFGDYDDAVIVEDDADEQRADMTLEDCRSPDVDPIVV